MKTMRDEGANAPGRALPVERPDTLPVERPDTLPDHLLTQLADAVVVTDADLRIVDWNPAAARLYGLHEDARHRPARDVLHTQYFGDPDEPAAHLRDHGHWAGDVVQRRADGSAVHVFTSITLLTDGEATTGAVAINRELSGLDPHLESALEAGRTTVWSWEPGADRFEWSDNAADVHGIAPDRLGRTWDEALAMVHPDDRERVMADAQTVLGATAMFETEYRTSPATTDTRWLICRGRGMRDDEGRVTRIVGTVTDVTERRRVEDALRATEERLRTVVANAPIVLFAFDAAGRITLAEGAALPAIEPLSSFVPPANVQANIQRVLQGESFRADVEFDGAVYDTWYQPLLDGDRVAGGFGVSTDVTERKRAELELAHQAVHDPLTGLPNRVLFLDRLSQALRRASRRHAITAVLFFDLDRFKLVNDSHGHSVGDEVLVEAAARLQSLVRPADTIARFGGDEFVVLCEDLVGELEAVGIAERVVDGLKPPIEAGGVEIHLSTSVGIALATGGDQRPDDVIRDADVAMYRAKESGRSRWELFDEHMRDRAVQQLRIRNSLPGALDRGELCLHYQPAIRLSDGAMRGAEALVRWQHPTEGLIAPAEFIPVAEEAGLLRAIGMWVLTEACRQVSRWNRLVRPALHIAVNLSARQLLDPTVVADVAHVLADTATDPGNVCLEVRESALVDDTDAVIDALHRLKELGVRLAIDDFGAGQSALGHLRQVPVDVLKLDRVLAQGLSDPKGVAVVRSVIELAHALDLVVVAEGVETSGQLDQLAALGCDLAQGYFLGRPADAGAMSGLLS
jgi:diguanylate cyclase (GGDEF)-like protein/PAS domain S-box-containing protein